MWNILPRFIKNMRHTWVLEKKKKKSIENEFLYDYRMLSKLNVESYSQFGQDFFIYNCIFNGKSDGIFMDVGGNDPIIINNTYLFETKGWTGFAFEPIKTLCDKWGEERDTPCFNVAIGSECIDAIRFSQSESDVLSGIGIKGQIADEYMIRQETITSFLDSKNITCVDLLFIDVEGYEMEVLKGIDFDRIDISCICVENNRKSEILPDLKMRDYLISKGYRLIARLTIDDVFVKGKLLKK